MSTFFVLRIFFSLTIPDTKIPLLINLYWHSYSHHQPIKVKTHVLSPIWNNCSLLSLVAWLLSCIHIDCIIMNKRWMVNVFVLALNITITWIFKLSAEIWTEILSGIFSNNLEGRLRYKRLINYFWILTCSYSFCWHVSLELCEWHIYVGVHIILWTYFRIRFL